jgi:hypothetical protein
MSDTNGSNGTGTPRKSRESAATQAPSGAEVSAGNGSNAASSAGAIEYYILCPQRATDVPGLITHLISRDICEKRQTENYHKCPNCVRSRIWRERNGLPVEEPAAAR